MTESELYRELATAHEDVAMWRNLVALMPWTVHVDHAAERSRMRAIQLLGRIPTPRPTLDRRLVARR